MLSAGHTHDPRCRTALYSEFLGTVAAAPGSEALQADMMPENVLM